VRNFLLKIFALWITASGLSISFALSDSTDEVVDIREIISGYFVMFAMLGFQLYWIFIYIAILGLSSRIEALNGVLKMKLSIDQLNTFSTILIKIHQVFETFNKLFGLSILIIILASLCDVIFALFEVYILITITNVGYIQYAYSVMSNIGSLHFLIHMVILIKCCSNAKKSVEKLNENFKISENCEKNAKILKRRRILAQELVHMKPVLSCGLFEFNWELMLMVIEKKKFKFN
jgi:7tm Chemosensory receptor